MFCKISIDKFTYEKTFATGGKSCPYALNRLATNQQQHIEANMPLYIQKNNIEWVHTVTTE